MSENYMVQLKRSLNSRKKRQIRLCIILFVIAVLLAVAELILGNTIYSISTVWSVLLGNEVKGATFAIWQVRLPRLLSGILAGIAFGISGNTFQTMLRNPLASPDMIGISSGASVAAVFCILVLGIGKSSASFVAVLSGIVVALIIYGLSSVNGFSNGKLILIGIGTQAMMRAVISYILLKAAQYDVPTALRWLSGSLNGVQLKQIPLLAVFVLPLSIIIILYGKQLRMLELGDSTALVLGVRTYRTRAILIICSVIMAAFATSVTGPISCVTFLAGPIASHLVKERGLATLPSALIGIILILSSDLVGQYMLGTRFPVGVITGILGAPYLLYLLLCMNRKGKV